MKRPKRKFTESHKNKIRLAKLGTKLSEEHKRKVSLNHADVSGNKNPFYGKTHTEKTRKKISIKTKERMSNPKNNYFYGRRLTGSLNGNWKGGTSFMAYPSGWNRKFKEQIRARDDYICQACNRTQKNNREKLCIHHIDYDKKNIFPINLISLCKRCHAKTAGNREEWEYFLSNINLNKFKEAMLKLKYNGITYETYSPSPIMFLSWS